MSEEITKKGLAAKISAIMGALGTTIYGVSFMENPVGFVAAAVIDLVVGWVADGVDHLTDLIGMVFGDFTGALAAAGAAAADPFGTAGGILLDLTDLIESLAVDLAMGVGPLAPIIAVVLWGLAFVAFGLLIRGLIEIYRWTPGT